MFGFGNRRGGKPSSFKDILNQSPFASVRWEASRGPRGLGKSRNESLQIILTQSPFHWDEEDVRFWLKENGFGSADRAFKKNAVNGELLCTLTEDDLIGMKIKQLGVRKSLLRAIEKLLAGKASPRGPTSASETETDSQSTSVSSTRTNWGSYVMTIEDCEGDSFEIRFRDFGAIKYNRVFRKVAQKLNYTPAVYFVWADKSFRIEDDEDLVPLLGKYANKPFTFMVQKKEANDIAKMEREMLESLVDAALVTDKEMKIIFVNKKVEGLTGYTKEELLGKSVTCLMPFGIAKSHHKFVNAYLDGKSAKVVGMGGRTVLLMRKDKKKVSIWLTISEQKKSSGRHTFFGTLHKMKARIRNESLAKFAILDGIQKVVIVINQYGSVQFMNQHAEKLLGYDESSVGENIKFMMPEPYDIEHDSHIRNYLKSGKAKVIGKGVRVVVAKRKDGSVVAVELALQEVIIENKRYFIAIIEESAKNAAAETFTVLEETRGVVNSLSVPAIVIDKEKNIQAFNTAAEELLGWDLVDVVGENITMLMGDEDAKYHDSYVDAYLKTGIKKLIGNTTNVMAKTFDGTMVSVALSISKIDGDDGDFAFTAVLTPLEDFDESSTSESSASRSSKNSQRSNVMSSVFDHDFSSYKSFKDFGVAEDANKKHRKFMEDSWVIVDRMNEEDGAAFFGVYDGHGGAEAAAFAARKLHKFFQSKLNRKATPKSAFTSSYSMTHDTMGSEIGRSGCTALTSYLRVKGGKRLLMTANVGDSRAILIRDGNVSRLSKDHKVTDPEEVKLLKAKKAMIINGRISGILAVSRSLGDYKANKYVIRDPYFDEREVKSGDILVHACDGLFDVCTDKEVLAIVLEMKSNRCKKIAKKLVDTAIEKKTTDNVTCMVIKL